jgi:uncharacterized protein YacL
MKGGENMLKKAIRWFVTLLGFLAGAAVANALLGDEWLLERIGLAPLLTTETVKISFFISVILVFGIIFYILFPLVLSGVQKLTAAVEKSMEDVRMIDVALACAGLIIGLVIAALLSFAFNQIPVPWISGLLSAIMYISLGYIGFTIPVKKRDEIISALQMGKRDREMGAVSKKLAKKRGLGTPKILDTSVIIDGRIHDICKAGFLEGPLILPVFVLKELQLIADSGDDLKRIRGRRGLDIIKAMQSDLDGLIVISDEDYDDIAEVDTKLMRMAKEKKHKILTNDYNLNKVASVQGIDVLNINELANAVKPVVLPGEEMKVLPVKNGKESGQAVAYLNDGTMIVVENGRRHIGDNINVIVTSILQTAAGRMIFAKPER